MSTERAKVAILMSTFNGEEYLEEQIKSLINQNYQNWELVIRDDGSTDSTPCIIKRFISLDGRIKLLDDEVIHRGVRDSFLFLLKKTSADYYCFCDQDDVWLNNKIEESVHAISEIDSNCPAVACSDLKLVDVNLNSINQSMWETHHIVKLVDNPHGLKIASMFPGCTMIFNNATKKIALAEDYKFPLHDNLISMTVYKNNGRIIPIHKSLILYRQHSNNVVGVYIGKNWLMNKFVNIRIMLKNNIAYYKMVHQYLKVSKWNFIALKIKHLLHSV